MHLFNFQIIRPAFESTQQESLDWLIDARVKSAGNEELRAPFTEKLMQVGCKPGPIEKRGHVLADFQNRNWEEMEVYRIHEKQCGEDLSVRSKVFEREADKVFEAYYPEGAIPPDELIHVSCTGYVSPSGAQKIVSKRNWGNRTTVTHAYHMGCYGAIAGIRIGRGFVQEKNRVDLVHTEICCLHINPSLTQTDQLVSQSLFADGFIKYSIAKETKEPSFKIIAVREEIIPDSLKAMTWNVMGWGFQMSLGKEVPVLITRHVEGFLDRLVGPDRKNLFFAVHPGGPKILNHVQKVLQLSDEEMRFSYAILKEYGNMSSATLPHIWDRILRDPSVPNGTRVASMAFGPGLSIAGALLEKSCGS